MGNCTGVFGACVGDNADPKVIKTVDKEAMKKAMAVNQNEFTSSQNPGGFGSGPE